MPGVGALVAIAWSRALRARARCLGDSKRDPPLDHRLALPSLHVADDASQGAVQVLDRVGRGEGAAERGRQVETEDGERLVETLAQASGGGVFAIRLEPRYDLQKQLLGGAPTPAPVGVAHLAAAVGTTLLWQMVTYVARLVDLAALHNRSVAEDVGQRLADALTAVDDE